MDVELIETLRIIIDRFAGCTQGSVFIPIDDFPWADAPNYQLTRLFNEGMIAKPLFFDNGAEITLTSKGRSFFDRKGSAAALTKEKIYEILLALSREMKILAGNFGYEAGPCRGAIKQLKEQGYIADAEFSEGGWDPNPKMMWLDHAYVTIKGLEFIEDFQSLGVDLTHEFITACAKIADNPVSYSSFDEDGLNREIRNFLDSAISRFGFVIADQTQQGLSGKKPGELDIRINKNGIPVAIYEGLIHKDKQYLFDHVSKTIGKYNLSGCKAVYIIDFSRNKGFGGFWDGVMENLDEYEGISVHEENTQLLGVRMLKGTFDWNNEKGNLFIIGVNCYT